MPPPPQPGRRSSGNSCSPRSSTSSDSSTTSNSSGTFSARTKLQVTSIAGKQCWVCLNQPVHVCHAFSVEDTQVELWEKKGLINFSLTSYLNGFPLCPTCHANFDTMVDPGFILVPTDINYFIEFEENDRDRRQRAREIHGKTPQREFPTAAQYKEHQAAQGLVRPDAVGGLYPPVFLKPFLHPGALPFDIVQYFSYPRPWHGAPSASLQRAMHVLGGARLGKLGPVTLQQLWTLQKLYFLDNDEDDFVEQHEAARTGQKRGHGHEGHGQSRGSTNNSREPDDSNKPDDSEQSHAKKQPISSHDISSERATNCPPFLSNTLHKWDLGPHITAQDAVQRFAPYV